MRKRACLRYAIWVRFAGEPRPDNLVHEYFQVRNGAFAYIWSCNYQLPKGSPVTSGWENQAGRYHSLAARSRAIRSRFERHHHTALGLKEILVQLCSWLGM